MGALSQTWRFQAKHSENWQHPLDLELPDLPVQLGLLRVADLLPSLPPFREDRGQLLKQQLPPPPDLVGMNAVVAG